MFNLVQAETYTWPVRVSLPADGGRSETHDFEARFKRLTTTRLESVVSDMRAKDTSDVVFAREIMVGWAGIVDAKGDVPFSSTALDMLLDIPTVASSIVQAFFESHSQAARKN